MVQLGLKDLSRDITRVCGMSFVSYSHLILLISGQTFEVTVVHKKFWELNRTLVSRKKFGQNFLATFATLIRSIK